MAMASRKLKNVSIAITSCRNDFPSIRFRPEGSKGTTTSAKAPPTSRSASLRNAVGRVSIFDAIRRIEMTSRLVSFVTAPALSGIPLAATQLQLPDPDRPPAPLKHRPAKNTEIVTVA